MRAYITTALEVAGTVSVVYGLNLIYRPAAFIGAGIAAIAVGIVQGSPATEATE
jgi:hypothetical protein